MCTQTSVLEWLDNVIEVSEKYRVHKFELKSPTVQTYSAQSSTSNFRALRTLSIWFADDLLFAFLSLIPSSLGNFQLVVQLFYANESLRFTRPKQAGPFKYLHSNVDCFQILVTFCSLFHSSNEQFLENDCSTY